MESNYTEEEVTSIMRNLIELEKVKNDFVKQQDFTRAQAIREAQRLLRIAISKQQTNNDEHGK